VDHSKAVPQGLMGWTAPATASLCQDEAVRSHPQEPFMAQVSTIGLDLAKNVFQIHGIDAQSPSDNSG